MSKQEQDITGKRAYHLMPWAALDQVALVFAFGAQKHGEGDYNGPDAPTPEYCVGAAFRHLSDHLQGEPLASDSQLPHLAHAAARALIALELELAQRSASEPPEVLAESSEMSPEDIQRAQFAGGYIGEAQQSYAWRSK